MPPSIRYGFWALLALTTLLYAGSVGIPFRIDDRMLLGLKPGIASWDNWTALFREPYYILPEAGSGQYYRPLPALLQKAQYALFDDTPVGYHLVNVGLHLINGWLVFRVARLVVRRASGAYFAAACFLLHPLQTEVVNYISHFTCLLSSTAMLSALLCYLLFRMKGETKWYVLSLLLSGAGMLSKESALVLPLIICWGEAVLPPALPRKSALERVAVATGYFLVLAAYLFMRRSLLGPLTGGLGAGTVGWLSVLTAGKGTLVYARLIAFPAGLHFFRSLAMEGNPWHVWFLLPIVSGIWAGAWILEKRKRLPPACALGFGWLAIGLLPVSGIKPLYMQTGVLFWAEHFLYFPLAGAALLAAGLGDGLAEGKTRRIVVLGAALAACWIALTLSQNLLWRNEVRFARKSVKYEPRIFRTHELLAKAYFDRGRYEEAAGEFEEAKRLFETAARISPTAVPGRYEGYHLTTYLHHLSAGYRLLGRHADARRAAQRMMEISPDDYAGYYLYGLAALEQGKASEALPHLRRAYELKRNDFHAAAALILCLEANGEGGAAKRLWMEAAREIPAFAEAARAMDREKGFGAGKSVE